MNQNKSPKFEVDGNVAWIRLDRPQQRNALDIPTLTALTQHLRQLDADDRVRAILLTGTGQVFCAGADLAEWAAAEARGELETYGWTEAAHEFMWTLYNVDTPTIAAINGTAVGAGMDLCLCCDFRVAARSARFKAGYTGMGYSPDAGASWNLPRIIGEEEAKRLLFLDEPYDAEQALSVGLVGRLVDDDKLADEVGAFAARIASGPTLAFKLTKQLMRGSARHSLAEHLKAEQAAGLMCGHSEDGAEALRAVVEKRQPQFIGH